MSINEGVAAPTVRAGNRTWQKFRRNRLAMAGAMLVGTFVVLGMLAPILAPYDPIQTSFLSVRQPPSASWWLGTDELGRDIFSRMLFGARASLLAGVVSVSIAMLIGVPLGLLAGYFGGWIDACISRLTDALLAIPFLILAIALSAFLGPSLTNAMIAIGVSVAPRFVDNRSGPGAVRQRRGLCAKREGDRCVGSAHSRSAYPAERRCAPDRAGDDNGGNGHHCRSQPLIPGARPSASRSSVGIDAEHRQELHDPGALDVDLPRSRDFRRRTGLQSAGRRRARCARSSSEIVGEHVMDANRVAQVIEPVGRSSRRPIAR